MALLFMDETLIVERLMAFYEQQGGIDFQKTVKDVIGQEMAHDLFFREGEGWISIVDSTCEAPGTDNQDDGQGLVFIGPAVIETDDLEKRICLAGLTDKQADKN